MYAIIESGGKQYRVEQGDVVDLELLTSAADGTVEFDRVLAIGEGEAVEFGSPVVESATVSGRLVDVVRDDKVTVFKKKRRKGYAKKQGHRQNHVRVEITAVARG